MTKRLRTTTDSIIGYKLGRLTITSRDNKNKLKVVCACECGKVKSIYTNNINRGLTTSCGCFRKENLSKRSTKHGARYTDSYKSWSEMVSRCSNPNITAYDSYGGRGIGVCNTWKEDFRNFLSDMGDRPKNYTLERIDNMAIIHQKIVGGQHGENKPTTGGIINLLHLII